MRCPKQCSWCLNEQALYTIEGATTDLSLIRACEKCLPEILKEIPTAKVRTR